MAIRDKTERGLVCLLLELHAVCIREWSHKCSPVLLMIGEIERKAHEDGFIESFGSAVLLWMMSCPCQKFNTKEGAHRGEDFGGKLSTIVKENIR